MDEIELVQRHDSMTSKQPNCIPSWIPTEMQSALDLTELVKTDLEVLKESELLSSGLEANVAAYPAGAKGRQHGLCSVYRSAKLNEAQLRLLRLAEQKHPHVVFVAYCKPLQRHNEPNESLNRD